MDESARKLISGSIIVTMGITLGAICMYAFRIILTSHLSVEKIGLYFSMLSMFIFLGLFQKLGTDVALVRFITLWVHEQKHKHIQKGIITLAKFQMIIGIALCLLIFYFSKFLSIYYFKDEQAVIPLCILALSLFFLILEDLSRRVFQGLNDMMWFSWLDLFKSILLIICTLVGFTFSVSIMVPIVSYLIATLCTGILGFAIITWKYPYILLSDHFHPKNDSSINSDNSAPTIPSSTSTLPSSKQIFKEIFVYSMPLIFIVLGNRAIESLDLLTLTYFGTLSQVGVYSIVILTSSIALFLFRPVSNVIMPITTTLWVKNDHARIWEVRNNIFKYLYLIMIPVISVFVIFSKEILLFFFGAPYATGELPLQIILCGVMFYGFANINISILSSMNHSKSAGMVMVYATVIAALLNFSLIPFLGMLGAAISTAFAYFATYLFSNHDLKKWIHRKTFDSCEKKNLGKITLLFIYAIIIVPAILLKTAISFVEKGEYILIFLTGYLIIVTCLKLISFSEIKELVKQGTSKEGIKKC